MLMRGSLTSNEHSCMYIPKLLIYLSAVVVVVVGWLDDPCLALTSPLLELSRNKNSPWAFIMALFKQYGDATGECNLSGKSRTRPI